MAKAVSNREICFIKEVLFFHFSLNFAWQSVSPPPILLGLTPWKEGKGLKIVFTRTGARILKT